MRRIVAVKSLYLVVLLLFFSCNRAKKYTDKQIFRYNEAANIASLDPAFAKDQSMIWVCLQLFNGLVELDKDLNIRPSIAKDWTISSDKKEYRFNLRQDVFFHKSSVFGTRQTRKVVAADFVYSFNRIIDEKVASPGAWIFNNVASGGFIAENDSTFVIKLKQPYAPFLGMLTMPYCSVVPHEALRHFGADFRRNPVGTGAFRFKMWKEGVKLVLLRNDDYFETDEQGRHLPYLDAINISFIIDKQSVFLEFIKGNIDFISGIDATYKDELLTRSGKLQPKYADKINLYTQPYLNTEYLGFLMDDTSKDNPLSNIKVRQAINYGFDRKKMMRYLRNNIGSGSVSGMIPEGLAGFDSTKIFYNYDPAKAKALLAEAGYPNGKGMPTITLSTTSSYLDLCKYIQQQLILLGMEVKIDVNPPAALREQIAQGKSRWFRGSWIADFPDAENYLSLFYSGNLSPKGPNYTHFYDRTFDALYRKAQAEPDINSRKALYEQMNALIMAQSPVVVLYYDQVLRFVHKNISGLEANAMNLLILKRVKIDNPPAL
ncbi:MAG: ABC transporter substrate-binding protein [Bacteroidales bacterium]|jgi:peptide/nickel transport system substrate-binding protein|nr:ABC transporter substrate-binding protein [Bacteroidales bacterium]